MYVCRGRTHPSCCNAASLQQHLYPIQRGVAKIKIPTLVISFPPTRRWLHLIYPKRCYVPRLRETVTVNFFKYTSVSTFHMSLTLLKKYYQNKFRQCHLPFTILSKILRCLWRSFSCTYKMYELTGVAQQVQRLAKGWTVRGSNPGGQEIFRTRPDRPWGLPSLLYNAYRVFIGGKAAGAWC